MSEAATAVPPMMSEFFPKAGELSLAVLDKGVKWTMVEELSQDLLRDCLPNTLLITQQIVEGEPLDIEYLTNKGGVPTLVIVYDTADIPEPLKAAADHVLFGKLFSQTDIGFFKVK